MEKKLAKRYFLSMVWTGEKRPFLWFRWMLGGCFFVCAVLTLVLHPSSGVNFYENI